MDAFNLVICVLDFLAGLFTLIGGIIWMAAHVDIVSVVLGIYLMFATPLQSNPKATTETKHSTQHNRIFGIYIMVSEVFMPARLQVWLAFYLTWTGKALVFIFLGVFFIIPMKLTAGYDGYFVFAVIYLLVLAMALIVLQILSCLSVTSRKQASPIIVTRTTTTTTTSSIDESLV